MQISWKTCTLRDSMDTPKILATIARGTLSPQADTHPYSSPLSKLANLITLGVLRRRKRREMYSINLHTLHTHLGGDKHVDPPPQSHIHRNGPYVSTRQYSRLYNLVVWTIWILNDNKSYNNWYRTYDHLIVYKGFSTVMVMLKGWWRNTFTTRICSSTWKKKYDTRSHFLPCVSPSSVDPDWLVTQVYRCVYWHSNI